MEKTKVTGKDLKNEYQRNWRKAHPEKAKQHQEQYWERKAKEINEANEN